MATVELDELLDSLTDRVKIEFSSMPDIENGGSEIDLSKLPIEARRWVRIDDVVAVVADLKNSTGLGTGSQRAASTASIYEAAVNPIVHVYDSFDADAIEIQGDGAFAVFWGDSRYERAMCAGITVKTFSESIFEPRLETKWPDLVDLATGYKVGIASSRILVKRVGLPRTDIQEEVWAGKAVNYATKAAQSADRRELVVTGTVWDEIETNDYIAFSCGCNGGPSDSIWQDIEITKLSEDEPDRFGRKLTAKWCKNCGPSFCEAIMQGETARVDTEQLRTDSWK